MKSEVQPHEMNEHSATFDSLPTEVILQILINVAYSKEGFKALKLVNHRIHQMIAHRGCLIFNDIAYEQFPHAVAMKRLTNYWPHSTEWIFSAESQVRELSDIDWQMHHKVDNMAEIEAEMLQLGLLGGSFGVKGWKRNALTGLYVLRRLQELVHEPGPSCQNTQALPRAIQGSRSRHLVDSLPLSYCLAVRHTTLLMSEVINFLFGNHQRYGRRYNGSGFQRRAGFDTSSDRLMTFMFENHSSGAFSDMLSLTAFKDADMEYIKESLSPCTRFSLVIDMATIVFTPDDARFDRHITRRIGEAIENWDEFAVGEGKSFLGDLERTNTGSGEHSVPSAKALVHSFLDRFPIS